MRLSRRCTRHLGRGDQGDRLRGAGRAFCAGADFSDDFSYSPDRITTDGQWTGKDLAFFQGASDIADAEGDEPLALAEARHRPDHGCASAPAATTPCAPT